MDWPRMGYVGIHQGTASKDMLLGIGAVFAWTQRDMDVARMNHASDVVVGQGVAQGLGLHGW